MVDHYERPRNVGAFDKNDANVGTGLVGAPACGDVMKLQVRVSFGQSRPGNIFVAAVSATAISTSALIQELEPESHYALSGGR